MVKMRIRLLLKEGTAPQIHMIDVVIFTKDGKWGQKTRGRKKKERRERATVIKGWR